MRRLRLHIQSISTRILAALASLAVLLAAVIGTTVLRHRGLSHEFEQLATEDFERLSLIAEINENANDVARKMFILIHSPRESRLSIYTEIDAINRRLDASLTLLSKHHKNSTDASQYAIVVNTLDRYRQAFVDMADLIEAGDLTAAQQQLTNSTDFELSMVMSALQNLAHNEQHGVEARVMDMQKVLAQDRLHLLEIASAALIVVVMVGWWSVRRVVTPLKASAQMARQFAQGDYTQRLPMNRQDEVGQIAHALNHLADEVSQREQRLQNLIGIDSMTRLTQRSRFLTEGQTKLAAAAQTETAYLMICFDIDRLKTINAVLGFDAGDAVICEAAQRLSALAGQQGLVSRLAGGTFVALLDTPPSKHSPREHAASIQRALEQRVDWQGHALDLSVTLGVVRFPQDAQDAESLLRQAEQALYEGKRRRVSIQHYNPAIEVARASHLSLLTELQQAIAGRQLQAFLQPKLCLRSHRIVGAEALVRWRHPQRGWISPGEFIPFAEQSGRITLITQAMLEQVVTIAATHEAQGHHLKLAVNLSTYDLRDPGLPNRLSQLLAQQGVSAQRLQLEVTESGLLDSGDLPIACLQALHDSGIGIAIDDFGTGQSSLAYLQKLPASELKIDRSFVADADSDPKRQELLAAIVRLGKGLGLTVTAEGVETAQELAMLQALGCDLAQGYFIGRPMPVADFAQWYSQRLEQQATEVLEEMHKDGAIQLVS